MKRRVNPINEVLQGKGLKELKPSTPLPYGLDRGWDAKVGADLVRLGLTKNPDVLRLLAEGGFDVKKFQQSCLSWRF